MFDKLVDRHKNPWNQLFHLLGGLAAIYGLWMHDWYWIIGAIVILIIGHSFPNKKKKKK